MSKRTFASRTFAPRHYNSATWTGEGPVVVITDPVAGWTAQSRGRVGVPASRERVWIAKAKQ